ncbi:MAG: hypothetical protein EOR67_26590 [Mesorhizobium sp.]|nr:MAG: hypothetical protein EOR69_27240 [Mesorhizobium sp.]RWL82900.1 MAG: hypothetical protein EOR67_26590 [Mesorhizobium sp.]RWL93785.1 MAG: hypothetical protein EOR70_27325 [Mesorhizobium sp.]TIP00714.1 MAG: hypothetical protein E5X72_28805 [Mesorhizobium sp.]
MGSATLFFTQFRTESRSQFSWNCSSETRHATCKTAILREASGCRLRYFFCARWISLIMRCCRHENLQRAEETKVGSHVVRDGWTEGVEGALHPALRPAIRRASVLG